MEASVYLPTVAWRTYARDVILLTEETILSPATYRISVQPIDINDLGAATAEKQIGFYFKDYVGHTYTIIAYTSTTIDVSDDFRCGVGAQSERQAVVYKSVGDGLSPYLAPIYYRHLDKSALEYSRQAELDILWRLKQNKLTCTGVKTANYTANPFELIPCDISDGSFAITLPDSPQDETIVFVKLNVVNDSNAGVASVLTLATSGTDHFNTPTGTVEIYMYMFGEYAQMQYCASTGVWTTFISAATYNFATQFPGIDATTPIMAEDISINYLTRVLTITPPLGYFNVFTDGGGVITRFRKVGTINFPAFTDTTGIWYFYFNNLGQAVTTQTAWNDFSIIASVYRILWNNLLYGFIVTSANATIGATYTNNGHTYTVVDTIAAGTYLRMSCSTGLPLTSGTLTKTSGTGDSTITFSAFTESEKSVGEDFECHENTISADDHAWKHKFGAIWFSGQDCFHNMLTSGIPNVSGLNTCIGLSGGMNFDDNLSWPVINGTGTDKWTQDLGTNTASLLTTLTGGKFAVRYQAGSSVYNLPTTRFPFAFSANNIIEFITSTGVRTEVTHTNFTVYYLYSFPDPRMGLTIKSISSGVQYSSFDPTSLALTNANSSSWNDIKVIYPTLNDGEIRPLYRLIYESRTGYDVAVKKAALRDVADIRTERFVVLSQGAGAAGDHTSLSNLTWGNSAHTGTINTIAIFNGSGAASYINFTVQALSGTTVSWDANSGINATLTLSGNTTITLSNLVVGTSGNIRITNASTAYTLTVSGYTNHRTPSCYIAASDQLLTSAGGSKEDIFSWYYDGNVLTWNGARDNK